MNEHQKNRFSAALRRLAGDADLLCCMASMVAADANEVLAKLTRATEAGDTASASVTAHQLKGMLSTFETDSPVVELQELIDSARRHDADATREQFQTLEPQLSELLAEISALQEFV